MKKTIIKISLLIAIFASFYSGSQTLTFSLTPQNQCFNGSNTGFATITSTPSGATSYSWASTSTSCAASYTALAFNTFLNIYFPCPAVYTFSCFAYAGTSLIGTAVVTTSVGLAGPITVAGNNTICSGTSATLTASGGVTYTWNPGGIVGATAVLSPSVTSTYTLSSLQSGGCTSSQIVTVYVVNQTLSISGAQNGTMCSSGSWIWASGASSYTWQPGSLTGSSIFVNPLSTSCYTVFGVNSCGASSAAICVTSVPAPTLAISASNTMCVGTSQTLTASGASNYYWSSPSFSIGNGSTAVISPTAAGALSVTLVGYNGGVCGSTITSVINVAGGGPTISVTSSSFTCGGSQTITASGATSYTWMQGGNTISNTSSIIVTPTATTQYYVYGSNGGSTCPGFQIVTVTVATGPTVSIGGNTVFCTGWMTNSNIWVIGTAQSYTWLPSNTTGFFAPTPTANTCYTLNATGANGCTTSATKCYSVISVPPLVVTGNTLICLGSSASFTGSGATNYSWTSWQLGVGNGGPLCVFTPTASGTLTLFANNGPNCSASISIPITMAPFATLTVAGPNTVCPGGSASLLASGLSTYTWVNGPGTAANLVTPSVSTCYSVSGTSTAGCVVNGVKCITVGSLPPISIVGSNTVCSGSNLTLNASGGVTYSWNTGGSTSGIVVSPSVNTCYTVMGTGFNGCSNSASICVTVNQTPTVTITGNNTLCLNSSVNLVASGATSYAWSNSSVGAALVASPISNTCYSVIGTNAAGCSGMASACVTVQTTILNISPVAATVCLGSSATFTASGANTYTWSTSANSATVNVLPLTSTNYAVSGTGSNGCVGSATTSVFVNSGCSQVWPGDANSDGIVNGSDVLEIGLAFNSTGAPRSPGGNSYVSQYATNWTGVVSSGKNKCHADCNGDGVVNSNDTLAISNNFSLSHAFRPAGESEDGDISLVADQSIAYPGQWNKADVILGSSSNQVSLLGVAFDLNVDPTYLDTDSVYLVYSASFLSAGSQNIEFNKSILLNNKIYGASVRTDFTNAVGNGKIAELWFKVRQNAVAGSTVNLSISNQKAIDNSGQSLPFTASGASIVVSDNLVGLAEKSMLPNVIHFFPNPAKDILYLYNDSSVQTKYTVTDMLGRNLISSSFTSSDTVDLSQLANGSYFVKFESETGQVCKKLIVQK